MTDPSQGGGGPQDSAARAYQDSWAPPPESDDGASLLDLLAILRRRWKLIVVLPLVGLVLVVAIEAFATREYVASARFMSASSSERSQLSAVAGAFGPLVLGGVASASGPEFYAELVRSRAIIRDIVQQEFTVTTDEGVVTGPLDRFIEIGEGAGAEGRIRRLVSAVRKRIGVSVQQRTGLVQVRTVAPYPDLAMQLTQSLLDEINAFNSQKRQTQASAARQFIESRLRETQADLAAAEAALERFHSENRSSDDSPRLRFERGRLERRVDIVQRVYAETAESLEEAKTEEVRNLALITVLEGPEGSVVREESNLLRKAFFTVLAGVGLGVGLAFAWERYAAYRTRVQARQQG